MHAVASAVAPVFTCFAVALAHPFPVAVRVIFLFPHLHEVITVVDVPLIIVGTDAGTGGNTAVGHHRAHGDARLTREETVANLAFVVAQKALTAVVGTYAPLQTCTLDELKHAAELLVAQQHLGVFRSPSHGEHAEQSPPRDALSDEKLLDFVQMGIVAPVHTRHDVPHDVLCPHQHVDGLAHTGKAVFVASHPVVVFLQPVHADGDAVESGTKKSVEALPCQIKPVAHHAPGEALLVYLSTAFLQVVAHQGLTSRHHDEDLVGVSLCGDAVEHTHKVLLGHILLLHFHLAVAATVAAMQVATERTLPEELPQRMLLAYVVLAQPPQFQCQLMAQVQRCHLGLFHLSSRLVLCKSTNKRAK